MERLKQFLRESATDFAGLIVFYALLWTLGLKAAIAGTIVFLAIDVARRYRAKLGFPRFYVLSGGMVVVFGAIDLASTGPFMIKYEAVITSLVLAAMFALGARGKSVLQTLVEQREGEPFEERADIRRFFKILTLLWAGYFLAKALVYLWIGAVMPIDRAMAVRPFIGTGSLVVMVLLMTQGRRLFALFRRIGILPAAVAGDEVS
jgi:intracellular septation protein A